MSERETMALRLALACRAVPDPEEWLRAILAGRAQPTRQAVEWATPEGKAPVSSGEVWHEAARLLRVLDRLVRVTLPGNPEARPAELTLREWMLLGTWEETKATAVAALTGAVLDEDGRLAQPVED